MKAFVLTAVLAAVSSPAFAARSFQPAGERTLETHSFYQAEGGSGIKIEIDRATIHGCYSAIGYDVSNLGENRYLVRVQRLMVPAVVCTAAMAHDIDVGATIEVEAGEWGTYAEVLIDRPFPVGQKSVVATGHNLDVETIAASTKAFDVYRYMDTEGGSFALDVDRYTIHNCYSGISHQARKTNGGYLVDIELTAVPAVVCTPEMARDIEVGVSLTIPGEGGFTYGELLVAKRPFGGASVPVVLKN